MIDIEKLARESGGSLDRSTHIKACLEWWTFSPDELQLFAKKVMQAAQQAERERRAKELVDALEEIVNNDDECRHIARAAISRYEESQ